MATSLKNEYYCAGFVGPSFDNSMIAQGVKHAMGGYGKGAFGDRGKKLVFSYRFAL